MMNWFAQTDFWSQFYDWMFPVESFEQAASQIDDLTQLLSITSGTVLDLGCGPGRFSVPLSKAGFGVTGVDLQPYLIEKAQAYAASENVTIEWVEADMRRFQRTDAFNVALNLYSSFGYFDNPEKDFRVIENVYASLKQGGQLLIDLRGKEIQAMKFTETHSSEMANGDLGSVLKL